MLNLGIALVVGLFIAGIIIWTDKSPMTESISSFDDDPWN